AKSDSLERLWSGRGRLLLAVDVFIVPTRQAALRHPEEVSDVGDVSEANHPSGLLQEAFGGISARNNSGVARSEKVLAAFTAELGSANDEIDRLGSNGKIPDGLG